jgi:ubiquinone/menaquinone biosynthesis C-methylase UbiE
VDPVAAEGYARVADLYERSRPSYPAEAVEWMAKRLALAPGRRVLDLAAGTGKLTRQLVATGAEIVAVEPSDAMREQLAAALPSVRALAGVAESIPLEDGAVDAVTVGHAFHWFDAERALPEIHRVLRSGGGLALAWNLRDEDDPLQLAITELLAPLNIQSLGEETRRAPQESGLFGPAEECWFPHPQELDEESLVARVGSISYLAVAPPEERRRIEAGVRELARDRPPRFTFLYRTVVSISRAS